MNINTLLLKIEKSYSVSLTQVSEDTDISNKKCCYKKNIEGEIVELNIQDSEIVSLSILVQLKRIEKLFLQNNSIQNISILRKFKKLRVLNLAGNKINDLVCLKDSISLVEVNLTNNEIFDISPFYKQLKIGQLKKIKIEQNPLIYPSLGPLEKNDIEVIITWFDKTWSLAKKLIKENKESGSLTLDLGNCGITDLSNFPELWKNNQIEHLILSNEWAIYNENGWGRDTSENGGIPNNIYNIPNEIGRLRNLKRLICGGDWKGSKRWNRWRISNFKPFSFLKCIEYLNVSNNYIYTASSLSELQKLEILHLNNNGIKFISVAQELPKLEEIYLSNNNITDINFLNDFPSVKTVDLHSNNIVNLDSIYELIEKLNITDSKWQKDTINIAQNPLKNPDISVINQGKANILAYFKQRKAELSIDLKPFINSDVKLVLVGNSNAGKSTLVQYLKDGKIVQNIPSTHWMEMDTLEIEVAGKKITVRAFDFGGQEYYHDTHHLFFTRQTAYILLWENKTNKYEEVLIEQVKQDQGRIKILVQGYPLSYWLDSIEYHTRRKNLSEDEARINEILSDREKEIDSSDLALDKDTEKPNILIVQNKVNNSSDISFLNQEEMKKKYSNIYDFMHLSIFEEKGLGHLKRLLNELIADIPIMGLEYLGTWGFIKNIIEKGDFANKSEVTLQEFMEICNNIIQNIPEVKKAGKRQIQNIMFNKTDARSFAQYLSDIGLILYFPHNEELEKLIFIKPEVILKKIYRILLGLEERQGFFDKKHVQDTLKIKVFNKECMTILKLMCQFKIIFPHPTIEHNYIAPLYLPKNPLKGITIFLSSFKKPTYRFFYKGYIHKHIILEFFHVYGKRVLKESKDTDLYYLWRYGLIVKDDNSDEVIMIKFSNGNNDKEGAYIDVFCLTSIQKNIFLESVMNDIHKINRGHKVDMAVTLDGIDFIPLSEIYNAEKKGNWIFKYKDSYYELNNFGKYLKTKPKMKKVFISYSKEDVFYLKKLENHLSVLKRNGTISTWNCRQLLPGEKWDKRIKQELEEADLILFLVSDDFLATDYIWDIEITRAIERELEDPDNVKVVPIIVRSCCWEESPLGVYNTASSKAQVLASSDNIDEAYKLLVKKLITIL